MWTISTVFASVVSIYDLAFADINSECLSQRRTFHKHYMEGVKAYNSICDDMFDRYKAIPQRCKLPSGVHIKWVECKAGRSAPENDPQIELPPNLPLIEIGRNSTHCKENRKLLAEYYFDIVQAFLKSCKKMQANDGSIEYCNGYPGVNTKWKKCEI